MELIPAIDLLDGAVVRLERGDFAKVTRYGTDAVSLARVWAREGARRLHVVDLAASRDGMAREEGTVARLVAQVPLEVQVAGGIRSFEDARRWLEAGAAAVVVGSLAASEPLTIGRMVAAFGPGRVVAAVDARVAADGSTRVATAGWTQDSGKSVEEVMRSLAEAGCRRALCTDIGRDGTLSGPNTGLCARLARMFPEFEIQASGGVRSAQDLALLRRQGVGAAVVGRALLEGRVSVAEALSC